MRSAISSPGSSAATSWLCFPWATDSILHPHTCSSRSSLRKRRTVSALWVIDWDGATFQIGAYTGVLYIKPGK